MLPEKYLSISFEENSPKANAKYNGKLLNVQVGRNLDRVYGKMHCQTNLSPGGVVMASQP